MDLVSGIDETVETAEDQLNGLTGALAESLKRGSKQIRADRAYKYLKMQS